MEPNPINQDEKIQVLTYSVDSEILLQYEGLLIVSNSYFECMKCSLTAGEKEFWRLKFVESQNESASFFRNSILAQNIDYNVLSRIVQPPHIDFYGKKIVIMIYGFEPQRTGNTIYAH